ncbi:MAG: LCP family protein [Anaerolineae bacterium]|nr:LCP family protein [Anaerolineae bacterium]
MSSPETQTERKMPLWAKMLIAGLLLGLFAGSVVWVYSQAHGLASNIEITAPQFNGVVTDVSAESAANRSPDTLLPTPTPQSGLLSPSGLQPWQGSERVTILLMGNDRRCEEEGPTRSDSLMVVSLDPLGKTASAVSLPRDSWVQIPGFDVNRINMAHYDGEAYEYPGGGPALAQRAAEAFLGIPIDYYLAINFDAFVQIVDIIGGIDIQIPETISDPNYPDDCYGYAGFHVEAGWYEGFDGQATLKYARTRATEGGDVDRAARQQAVLLAVRDKVLRLNMLPQLIRRAPQLWQALQDNVTTNLTDTQLIQLALLAQEIPTENIETAVLDFNYMYNEVTPDGRQVLVPNREAIRQLRRILFPPAAQPLPEIGDLLELMQAEGARVAVYNGTATFGLASSTQAWLIERGVDVVEIGNAVSAETPTTTIVDHGNHPYTRQYLVQQMELSPLNARQSTQPPIGDFDILITLGTDWETVLPVE